MKQMKWTKDDPGKYVSGSYFVIGAKTKWKLVSEGITLGKYSSKKDAQLAAEEDREPKAAPAAKPTGDEGTMPQLRLDITSLHLQMIELTDAVKRLTRMLGEED